jgi:hypothetical protein
MTIKPQALRFQKTIEFKIFSIFVVSEAGGYQVYHHRLYTGRHLCYRDVLIFQASPYP